jgi:prepilin-type N-terminal cleavage/methylation domain-containing protein
VKNTESKRLHTQGYSLLELVLVLAVVSVLVGLLLPKGFDALRNARIQQVEKTVDTLKTALTDYLAMAGGNGSLPAPKAPASRPRARAHRRHRCRPERQCRAARHRFCFATGKIEKPLALRNGRAGLRLHGRGR